MATEKLKFKIELFATHWNKIPTVEILINNDSKFSAEISETEDKPKLIEFEHEFEEEKNYNLVLKRGGKTNNQTIVNEKGDFSGSVSGGCVESAVVKECMGLIKENKTYKKIEFKVSNESAWEVGLACGGEIAVYLEQII